MGREREERGRKDKNKKKKGRKERRKIWMPSKFECQINNNFFSISMPYAILRTLLLFSGWLSRVGLFVIP